MQGTIKSKQRIDELFRRGSRLFAAGFMALSLPKEREEGTQELAFTCGSIAFIAGKKLGSAPQRSRAKRRLREAARAAGAPWTGHDVVLVAKAGVFRQDFKELVADLARFAGRFAPVPPPEDFQIYTASSSCGSTSPAKPRKQLLVEGSSSQPARLAAPPLLLLDDKTEVSSSTGNGLFSALVGIPRNIALLCINIYRHAISPLLPPSCRYVPTCSEYALIAFERFGFCRGLWLSIKRILRCNPLAKGGYDPVPEVRENKLAKYNAS